MNRLRYAFDAYVISVSACRDVKAAHVLAARLAHLRLVEDVQRRAELARQLLRVAVRRC